MSLIKDFIHINQIICSKIENLLPYTKPDITETYSQIVAEYANKQNNTVIVDIGGGRTTAFAKNLNPKLKHKLIVVDESEKELEKNIDANEILVADINRTLPLKSQYADLIVSRYVFEHLENLPNFVSNSNQVLKKGGYSVYLFSCKFALFAILNQILPNRITKFLLNLLIPDSKHIRGFKTNYNHCYYDAIINIFIKNRFSIKKVYISYYGSRYFRFFLPFYLISIIYEIILQILGIKNLCAYILIIAKKE